MKIYNLLLTFYIILIKLMKLYSGEITNVFLDFVDIELYNALGTLPIDLHAYNFKTKYGCF
jgi:hypothetical protein